MANKDEGGAPNQSWDQKARDAHQDVAENNDRHARDAIDSQEVAPSDIGADSDEIDTWWVWNFAYYFTITLIVIAVLLILLKLFIIWRTRRQLKRWGYQKLPYKPVIVGFFHPYCNAGGGGERVLWHSICALQKRYSFVRCVVYTGYEPHSNPEDILRKVRERFGINLQSDVKFFYLFRRGWVEANRWPRFTLLGQSIGSIILGFEALLKFAPHVYIDTMGYAFTMPLFRWLGGCRTASYVHYPIVSSDMLKQVTGQVGAFNNARWISRSRFLTKLKIYYYRLFAKIYGFMGRRSEVVMVNSTWTHGHISELWGSKKLFIVYPPCDTTSFQEVPIERNKRMFRIVSIGQFRPEKNHDLQLRVLQEFLHQLNPQERNQVKLVLIGSCRNKEDYDRVDELKHRAEELGVSNNVEFKIGIKFGQLRTELSKAVAALHTMWNEHFGIGLVECMAAGCIMIGHDSGGPKLDIIVEWRGQSVGYLADSEETFVSCLHEVLNLPELNRRVMAATAREAVQAKFSVEVFEASFLRATEHLFG